MTETTKLERLKVEFERLEYGIQEIFDGEYSRFLEDDEVSPVDIAFEIFDRCNAAERQLAEIDHLVPAGEDEDVTLNERVVELINDLAQAKREGSELLEATRVASEQAAKALAAIATIHQTIGRAPGHGTLGDTVACILDAIVSLQSPSEPEV